VFEPASSPEKWTLLQNILNRHQPDNNAYYNPNLYIKGVVNQEIASLTEAAATGQGPATGSMDPTVPTPAPVALYTGGTAPPVRLSQDVLVPANIKKQFAGWEQELLGASMVNIHSKVIVLDPFGENPVVMTGSHNLGFKASSENDDNLAIVEGNAPLAAAYAVNIIAIFQTYRWNSYVSHNQSNPEMWHGLVDNDQWQASYMQGDSLKEIQFWLGDLSAAPAAPAGGAAPPATAVAAPAANLSAAKQATATVAPAVPAAAVITAPPPHVRSHRVARAVAVRGHRSAAASRATTGVKARAATATPAPVKAEPAKHAPGKTTPAKKKASPAKKKTK
jgi:hypothetical protein